jgi:cold shock protein
MPSARVKVFDDEQNYGFLRPLEGGEDVFVHASMVDAEEPPRPGDLVEYDVEETDEGPQARNVTIIERAPEDSPAGRVVAGPPPTWDELEEIDKQRRHDRRQRRRRR